MNDAILKLLETGYGLQNAGRADEAETLYRKALAADPGNIHALNLLGIVCINSGRPEEAATLIEQAIEQNADDAEAISNLGLAYKDSSRFEDARAAFERAIQLNPGNAAARNNHGNVLAALGRHKEAVTSFRAALAIDGNYVECLSNLAASLKEIKQTVGALAAADHAIALRPDCAEAHNNRGEVLFKEARFEEAVESYRTAMQHRVKYFTAGINLSAALKEVGEVDQARKVLEDVINEDPDNPRAYNNLGVLLEQLGDGDKAAHQFRRAISLSPEYGNAYYQLAQLRGHGLTENEVDAVSTLLARPDLPDKQRMPLSFALACAFENRGDYERSFENLQCAQALKAEANPYDDEKVADYYASIKAAFSVGAAPLADSLTASQVRPVFILGMPRSGTSLTEQILGSHPDIHGAGELSFMEDTIKSARHLTKKPFPGGIGGLTQEQCAGLGRAYMERLKARSAGESVAVDKTPMNFQYIGFIAMILPQARFIHCRRNPMDNCLSIFKLPFEESHSYSHSLDSLGRYYRRYRDLMNHWRGVAGDKLIDVHYEDTVADLAVQSRRLLEFLDLPFDDAVLSFHSTRRIVKTPSASQVRQPIYNSSVEKWRKYEAHIGPLLQHLEEAVNA